ELHEVGDCPDPLLQAEDLSAGYPGHDPVLRGVSLSVRRGARIGILGRNGAGKSTLVRTLVGELAPQSGKVQVSRAVRIGYFAQQGIDRLRADESALAHLQRLAPSEREQALRDYLGRFGFSGDAAVRPAGPMSGGEKARLSLALMLHDRPQLLVLDEPTNHLDAQARDALADALADFDGAVLLVSHDRYLLRATVDTLMLASDGGLREFDGDLDDYADWLMQRASVQGAATRPSPAATSAGSDAAASRRDDRRVAAQRRARLAERLRPIEREIGAIEQRLEAVERQLAATEARLADPGLYRDPAAAGALGRERASLGREKAELEERWLERSTARDAERDAFERDAD
ncbi:MAG TPA: ATP-binding cassette domain-containing protein, partial [Burkholderiaceae bacterium]|nr:ATP-binding cassette domain-containing protein [Burkholderiaceae bacterium]